MDINFDNIQSVAAPDNIEPTIYQQEPAEEQEQATFHQSNQVHSEVDAYEEERI